MSKPPHTKTERPHAGAFLVRDGVVVAGRDPILVLAEIEGGGFDLLLTDGSQGQLADGWWCLCKDAITRRIPDAVGKAADLFPDVKPTRQRQHPHKALRRTRSPLRTA